MKRSLRFIALILSFLSLNLIAPVASAASVLGDVNGDGYITSDDARLALRFSAGMVKPTTAQKNSADMDNNGKITLEDVKLILTDALDIETYEESLLRQGFPKSYVEYLVELHKKYPQWEFVPMVTGLDWQKSVDGERSPHKKQLIENNVQSSYMCSCSSCKGVIQEAANWVSASEEAVKYYMDPRNFLNEQYIFQFESTAYDSSHTKAGVEAILKNTWMHDSSITYLNALGTEKTYKEDGVAVKYSDVILKSAKNSGLSAYYIASKIVQEVGSSSASNAGGASGKNAPFNGIYNYYNIGAYTGVRDGLEWANGFMKAAKDVAMYKSADTTSSKVITVPQNTELYYISVSGDFYRVSTVVNGTTYKGYIKKSGVSVYTSYGRPWSNPQKAIYYGAQYIYESFSETQYTGYLQKFNVNPESDTLYGHEYMANVRAAAAEAKKTYNAYASLGILDAKKVFSIPVFENMPGDEESFKKLKPTVTVPEYTDSSITLKWTSIDGADYYQIYKYNEESSKYERLKTTSALTYTDTGLSKGEKPRYKVRAYFTNEEGTKIYSAYSSVFYATVAPDSPTSLALVSKSDDTVKIKWSGGECTGYFVYRYDAFSGEYEKIATTSEKSYTDSTVDSGTAYKYKIRAYVKTDSRTFYSPSYTTVLSVTTTGEATAKKGYVNITDGYLNIRASASTSADVVAQLSQGHSLTILSLTGDWYKVSFTLDGAALTGYAHKDYIKIGTYSGTSTPEEPEKETCPYTEPDVTLRQGDSGDAVRWLQWYLYKLGYLKESDIDGSFGPTTLSAVQKFQTDNNLDVDGLVGSGTRGALKNEYGK
ncbi:MAG: hypothetical protein E7529_06300 [Ruminococcaceae bacterium]|nr:hypothetical protein [Oscillospiraceae bacterium]